MTAENTTGVETVHTAPPDFVAQQLRSVLDDIDVRAIKTGILLTAENVRGVTSMLKTHFDTHGRVPLVCDPVCVSTSGHVLLQSDAVDTTIKELFPLTHVITPNQAEAELLLEKSDLPNRIGSLDDMLVAARNLLILGSDAVLLKGRHIHVSEDDVRNVRVPGDSTLDIRPSFLLGENMEVLYKNGTTLRATELVVDVLCQCNIKTITLYPRPRLHSKSTHGTGCTLSAVRACALESGIPVEEATAQATSFTRLGIETAPPIGKGYGPFNHLHSASRLVPPRTPGHPYPSTHKFIQSTVDLWKSYVQHDFVVQLSKGMLDRASFIHFIKQDYQYYSIAYAIHTFYCAQFDVTPEELEATPESPATTAYGAFLVDVGLQDDTTKLSMALAACLLGYGEVGLWLEKEAAKPNSWVNWQCNPYRKWMEDYACEAFQNAVSAGLETIESRAAADPPSPARYAEWLAVWGRCVHLEKQFGDMALNLS